MSEVRSLKPEVDVTKKEEIYKFQVLLTSDFGFQEFHDQYQLPKMG